MRSQSELQLKPKGMHSIDNILGITNLENQHTAELNNHIQNDNFQSEDDEVLDIENENDSNPSMSDLQAIDYDANDRTRRNRRKSRTIFETFHLQQLEIVFQITKYPDVHLRGELANRLKLDEATVQTWFQNRRAKQHKLEKKMGVDSYKPIHHHEQSGLSEFAAKIPLPVPHNNAASAAVATAHSTELWAQNFPIYPTSSCCSSSLLHQNPLPATYFEQNNAFHAFIAPYMGLNSFGNSYHPHNLAIWPQISSPVMNNNKW